MMNQFPLVSVCIPCFNSGKYLQATIDSVLRQTYKNIEIIIVDDGSTDNGKEILSCVSDPRVHIFYQENKGAAIARNIAFAKSKGDFIKFMDADDLLAENNISVQVEKIAGKPLCLASGRWGRFCAEDFSDLKIIEEIVWQDYNSVDWIIDSLVESGTNMMQPGIFLISRELVIKAGLWNEQLSLIDDFEFMVRIMINSSAVLFCEEAILYYRGGLANSLSGQRSQSHMNSAYAAISISTELILNLRNDKKSRLACANLWQRWEYQFYPAYKPLATKVASMVNSLGGSNISVGGGRMFVLASKIIGWKSAYFIKGLLRS